MVRKISMTLLGVMCSTIILSGVVPSIPVAREFMVSSEDKDVPRMKLRRKNGDYLQSDASLIDKYRLLIHRRHKEFMKIY